MRLAYFSPLNPQPSGISDYSEELLPYLAAEAEVTLFVDGFEPSNPAIRERFDWQDYQRNPAVLKSLNDFDAIIYHMGNDHRYHAGMPDVAREHPGIVVFHDFALQDFFLGLAQTRGRMEIYFEELLACHGERVTREAAEAWERGSLPPQVDRPIEFPLNCRLARGAEGIIVHSKWSRSRFATVAPAVAIKHINMAVKLPAARESENNLNAERVLQVANFGLITPGKGIQRALRALAKLKADHNFHYNLVGQTNSFFDVRALIHECDMDDRVTITGHVSLEEFERRMGETDVALNLRERTVGETSASLCRIMAAGVPAIVFNVGAFSELPDDAVVKIDHDQNAEALLEAYLRRLLEDADLRQRMGANARRYIEEHHDIKVAAAGYLDFAREVIARRPRKQFLNDLSAKISSLGVRPSDPVLSQVAAEVAVLVPPAKASALDNPGNGNTGTAFPVSALSANNEDPRSSEPAAVRSVPPRGSEWAAKPGTAEQSPGRLPKIEGIDYKRAALEYPQKLDAERSHYLLTKPFYNLANKPDKHLGDGMDAETHRHFTDFANIARVLALPAGATILDVGCGSGWLSEYFARLGYDVTGIDISEELIAMARQRVARVTYDVDHETPLRCRFLTHDIETKPLAEKFDAVICYDSLHHFEDERAVFRHLAALLNVGGLLFILEGHKPASGSETEAELQGVMRQYGTLESPFSTDYLHGLLDEHGLAVVGDYVSVNGLFERELLAGDSLTLRSLDTSYHYVSSIKVSESGPAKSVPDSREPGVLRAEFSFDDLPPRDITAGTSLTARVRIRNLGDTLWIHGQGLRKGVVMPAVKVTDAQGEVVAEVHGNPLLPRAVAPGQEISIHIPCPVPSLPGRYAIKIDLVDQHICWFEQTGSQPLVFEIEVLSTA